MSDLDIEKSVVKKNIIDVATKLGLTSDDLILYGKDKAKIIVDNDLKKGKLILVTAINPTPYGEGKTTVSIGLNDGLNLLNKKSVAVLREPSMGPVFGLKGGATGGGYSQIIPSNDINLHFTGDIHAITSANNLLSASIDNHIYNGNSLKIDKILFNRCLDVNDRSLRKVDLGNYSTSFDITAASEIMSVFCLSKDLSDLEVNLGNIIIGMRSDNGFVFAKDLKIEKALIAILKDAFYPNLVQSLENNPVIVHGGPFANISIGCNSIKATNLGLSLADYVVTEAGFGADLGAEKFFDIKCRKLSKKPDCIVLTVTIRALKHYGSGDLEQGINNLVIHIKNLKKNNTNIVVALNKFEDDSKEDIEFIEKNCNEQEVLFSTITSYKDGGKGALDLANTVLKSLENENNFNYLYNLEDTIFEKMQKLASIYQASGVDYSAKALEKIKLLEKNNLSYLPICVAKTQYSISDDKNRLLINDSYNIHVEDIKLYNGAGFITVYLSKILTMPGLSKNPNYENIQIIDGNIVGIK